MVRIDGVEHENLQFYFKILNKDQTVVADQESAEIKGTGVHLTPAIFVVLEAGEYLM